MSEQVTSQAKLPGTWTLVRDVVAFILGWVVIFLEISRPEIREPVLTLGGILVGVPGAFVGASSIVEAFRRGTGSSP